MIGKELVLCANGIKTFPGSDMVPRHMFVSHKDGSCFVLFMSWISVPRKRWWWRLPAWKLFSLAVIIITRREVGRNKIAVHVHVRRDGRCLSEASTIGDLVIGVIAFRLLSDDLPLTWLRCSGRLRLPVRYAHWNRSCWGFRRCYRGGSLAPVRQVVPEVLGVLNDEAAAGDFRRREKSKLNSLGRSVGLWAVRTGSKLQAKTPIATTKKPKSCK